jgi:hypothetical protein
MKRTLIGALLFGLLATGIGEVQAQAPDTPAIVVVPKGAEEVWELEGKRRAALVAGDLKTFASLCADELTYTHTDGSVDTKESFLEMLSGGVSYETMDLHDVNVTRYDDTVVIVGRVQIVVKSPNGPIGFQARFTGVWAKQQGDWRFAAWQTTRFPG